MGISPEIRALVAKELRQVSRSRGALASATLLPILMLVVMPLGQLLPLTSSGQVRLPTTGGLPPGLVSTDEPTQIFVQALFPLFVMLGGLIVPSVGATYTVVAERERRSLELLMALPVSVRSILTAKLLAMLVMATATVVPLFAVDAVVLLRLGAAQPAYIAMLLLELLAALWCSIGIALLLSLLARDFRTANNLNGAMIGPLILLAMAVLFGVPGSGKVLLLSAILMVAGGAALLVGLRWLTFERYLA